MALTPTRSSNLRTAGWLMLTAFVLGLIAVVIASVWEKQSAELTLTEFFDFMDSSSAPFLLLFPSNLVALLAAVGVVVSPQPARLTRALIYAGIGAAIEFVLLLLTSDEFDPAVPFIFHLLSALALVLILVRKTPRPQRSLIRRSIITAGAWALAITLFAVLTFPFTQYGSATSATEAADVHQLRQISQRLLAAVKPELQGAKAPQLKATSENQASITGFDNFDCGFNTTYATFDANFGNKATLKFPAPELVPDPNYDPNAPVAAEPSNSTGTDAPSTAGNPYTKASVAASDAYWNALTQRVKQRLGKLPEGWVAKYGKDGRFIVTVNNEKANTHAMLALSSSSGDNVLVFFSALGQGCYPLDKAPNGTR